MNERNTLKINNNGVLEIAGVTASTLAKDYGTPLYVIDQNHLENMCNVFQKTLDENYGFGLITYASKAFSCKEVYRVVNSCNLGIDVVSGGELFTALETNFPSDKIFFHGNNKTMDELEFAVNSKVKTIVIDSYYEADLLDQLCNDKGLKQEVLIRINPGVEAHTHHYIQTANPDSKFGFSIATGDAQKIVKYVLSKENLVLKGLHCHIGSQIFDKKPFVIAVEKMTDFYKLIKEQFGYEFDLLDLGGGFGIYYSGDDLKLKISDYADYVKTICEALTSTIKTKGLKKPFLVLEPGRSIIGEAGVTLYTAGAIKEIQGLKNYLAIDGGMFDNPRFALYQAKYTVALAEKMTEKPSKLYTIAGKCCESGDIIAENCLLPEAKSGDLVAVFSTGAYNYSMASNYNRNLIPPVVFVKDGNSKIAVKKQTYQDLIRNDL